MTPTLTGHAAFLATIAADLADDTPRLVYADFLEEHGEPERAEFVKLQCRIASLEATCGCGACVRKRVGGQHHNGPCAVAQEREELPDGRTRQAMLRAREWELWADAVTRRIAFQWFPPPNGYETYLWVDKLEGSFERGPNDQIRFFIRRGFPAAVTLDCGTLCGERCERCEGCGTLNGAGRPGEFTPELRQYPCQACHGDGRTPGIAAALGRACPTLEAVTVTGKTPSHSGRVWNWYDQDLLDGAFPDEGPHEYGLPHELFVLLGDDIVKTADGRNSGCSTHPSPAAAHAARNAAALRLIFPERN